MNRSTHHLSTGHLSDHPLCAESLDRILLGASLPADDAHLASCPACSARLAQFHSAVKLFNQASATWSEARSNTIPRNLVPAGVSSGAAAIWSFASAAILAVAVSLAIHRESPGSVPGGQPESSPPQQEIASDNQLLGAINSEIAESVPSPVVVYGISAQPVDARSASSRKVREE